MFFCLVGCAVGETPVWHSFSFNGTWESPDITVLNYRYGNSKAYGLSSHEYQPGEGNAPQSTSIHGEMLRGDSLYVKWRIKKTGQVYEDTVDLKSRLPADIFNHKIHFIVSGPQLYVYLIGPDEQRVQPNPCPAPDKRRRLDQITKPDEKIFEQYCYLKITRLYPN
jgi:hypothetical protein